MPRRQGRNVNEGSLPGIAWRTCQASSLGKTAATPPAGGLGRGEPVFPYKVFIFIVLFATNSNFGGTYLEVLIAYS